MFYTIYMLSFQICRAIYFAVFINIMACKPITRQQLQDKQLCNDRLLGGGSVMITQSSTNTTAALHQQNCVFFATGEWSFLHHPW
jgi:hypothetical protein